MPYGFPSGASFVEIVSKDLVIKEPSRPGVGFRAVGLARHEGPWKPGVPEYDQLYSRENPLASMLHELGFSRDVLERFRTSLVRSQMHSVDAFLERRPEFIEPGKVAMAFSLLKHERNDLFKLEDHWYRFLWNQLNSSFDDFHTNQLSVITYNYDRSLEHFLFEAMLHTFGRSEEECLKKMGAIRFVHLHGSLGSLPWQGAANVRKFGENLPSAEALRQMASSMIVIHEGKDDSAEYAEAFRLMSEAKRIYFLGFGYGETNLKRLGTERLDARKTIQGTALGLPKLGLQSLQRSQRGRLRLLPGLDCLAFLKAVPLD